MADIYSGWTALGSLAGGYRMVVGSSPNAGGYAPVSWFAYRDAAGIYQVGGQLGVTAGVAATPSVAFSNDLDTGIFRATTNGIGFSTGGVECARMTSAGVGIGGVAAPYGKVEIVTGVQGAVALAAGMSAGGGGIGVEVIGSIDAIPAVQTRGWIGAGTSTVGINGDLLIAPRTSAACRIRFLTAIGGVAERWQIAAAGTFQPGSDNAYDIGTASIRVKTYYGVAGAINTSDGREKTALRAFTAAELSAARRIGASIGIYQFLASIAEKGEAGARLHCGVIAQDVWAIMADEGLIDPLAEGVDPDCPYAFLCWDRWAEEATEDGAVIHPAGDRFGIRPDQIALFLIAAQEARIAALEAAA